MSYSEWAIRLVNYFFGPQFEKQRVRLMLTRDVLDETFPDIGGTNGFLKSMRAGPDWLYGHPNLYQQGLQLHRQWAMPFERPLRYPEQLPALLNAPPFLPMLCLLCFAWTEDNEAPAAGGAFFARLNPLWPNHGLTSSRLAEWEILWKSLQSWSELTLHRQWGYFVVERLGEMPNVGIPKAQVILTPGRIKRLPELWTACSLQPDAGINSAHLAQVLGAHTALANSVLGHNVFEAIQANSDLGKSALTLLLEYLENWGGSKEVGGGNGGGGPGQFHLSRRLDLVLQPLEENTKWALTFGVRDCPDCAGLSIPDHGWHLTTVAENTLVIVQDASGRDVVASNIVEEWVDGLKLRGEWEESTEHVEPIRIKMAPTKNGVRVFDETWIAGRLVESLALPTSGGIYVLVSHAARAHWLEWVAKHAIAHPQQDLTWPGIPTGWQFLHLGELNKLAEAARDSFPTNQPLVNSRPRTLRLADGTRDRSNAARHIYAHYDPPMVILRAHVGATIDVKGATYIELPLRPQPSNLPGNSERSFALQIEAGASVVFITAAHGGQQICVLNFGVSRESSTAPVPTGKAVCTVNRFGDIDADGGIRGLIVPASGNAGALGSFSASGNGSQGQGLEHAAFRLLESLGIDNNEGRITFQEFRRRSMAITGAETWRISQDTRWLSQLGFIEIQTDSWGRWANIHRVPLHLYQLPFLSDGKYQAVLTGCGPIKDRDEIIAAAKALACELRVQDNGCKLVPPRILFLHTEPDKFKGLAQRFGLGWGAQPASFHLASWAEGLEVWLASLNWHAGKGPEPISEYLPTLFGIVADAEHHAPYRLNCIEDPYTRRHRWHVLVHNDAITGNGYSHAFVRDAAWGMWKAQNAIAGTDLTMLPYEPQTGNLVIPCQLAFPCLLGRALSACSGLVPSLAYKYPGYADVSLDVIPPDSPPYMGACWCYRLVPKQVAELVALHLCAELKLLNLT